MLNLVNLANSFSFYYVREIRFYASMPPLLCAVLRCQWDLDEAPTADPQLFLNNNLQHFLEKFLKDLWRGFSHCLEEGACIPQNLIDFCVMSRCSRTNLEVSEEIPEKVWTFLKKFLHKFSRFFWAEFFASLRVISRA